MQAISWKLLLSFKTQLSIVVQTFLQFNFVKGNFKLNFILIYKILHDER